MPAAHLTLPAVDRAQSLLPLGAIFVVQPAHREHEVVLLIIKEPPRPHHAYRAPRSVPRRRN